MVGVLSRRRLLLVPLVVVLLLWLVPPFRAHLTAVATVADGVGISSWRPFAPSVSTGKGSVGGHTADLYAPVGDAPTVVLVPGAVPAGRDDPRVEGLAGALARADRRVVVPELAVYDEQLVPDDVDRLVAVARAASGEAGPVVLVGISFGGSLALLAAADPRLEGRVAGVATFGAYADLVGVIQAATTGGSVVDGRSIPWPADPRAEEVVREQLVTLLPDREADAVRAALEEDRDPGHLPRGARAVHDLLANDDPERTYRLARALPPRIRERLAAVSPVAVADRLSDVPVLAMHTRDDPVIPYGELVRLGTTVPHTRLLTVDSLGHAGFEVSSPGGWVGAVDDLATITSFTTTTLRWQEPRWPWGPG